MKPEIIKDFERGQLLVNRAFAADLPLVWKAWTDAQLLEQWWAPKPWKTETKSMNFTPGGKWLYAMVGPEGEKHWAVIQYHEIQHEDYFKAEDAFGDEEGNINTELPGSVWAVTFQSSGKDTLVKIAIQYVNAEALQTILDMGMEEGFSMALDNLDELLKTLT